MTEGKSQLWTACLDTATTIVIRKLKDRASSSYYSPSSHGSPWESAKLAGEEADKAIARAEGETWEEFCDAVLARLGERRESFRANDYADPDGYVCNALRELMDEVERCKARGYEQCVRWMESAGGDRSPPYAANSGPPLWILILFGALVMFPILIFSLFFTMAR